MFGGEALLDRLTFSHGIAARKTDTVDGKSVERQTRTSLTFRKVSSVGSITHCYRLEGRATVIVISLELPGNAILGWKGTLVLLRSLKLSKLFQPQEQSKNMFMRPMKILLATLQPKDLPQGQR